jgi:hypothetical protein
MEEILIEIMGRKFKLVGNFAISKLIFNSSKIVTLNIYFSKIIEISNSHVLCFLKFILEIEKVYPY